MVVSLLRNPGGSEKREEKNQRESAINRMFSFRTIDRECETGMETRDEGKLKFRDTEGTLIGKGTEDPLARTLGQSNRNDPDEIPLCYSFEKIADISVEK